MSCVAAVSLVLTACNHTVTYLVLWRTTCEDAFSERWSPTKCRVTANAEGEKICWAKIHGIFPKRTKAVVEYFDYSQK